MCGCCRITQWCCYCRLVWGQSIYKPTDPFVIVILLLCPFCLFVLWKNKKCNSISGRLPGVFCVLHWAPFKPYCWWRWERGSWIRRTPPPHHLLSFVSLSGCGCSCWFSVLTVCTLWNGILFAPFEMGERGGVELAVCWLEEGPVFCWRIWC